MNDITQDWVAKLKTNPTCLNIRTAQGVFSRYRFGTFIPDVTCQYRGSDLMVPPVYSRLYAYFFFASISYLKSFAAEWPEIQVVLVERASAESGGWKETMIEP